MDGRSMIRRGGLVVTLFLVGASALLGGCNRGSKQQALAQQEAAELRERNAALEAQIGEKNTRIADLESRSQVPASPMTTWDSPAGRGNDGNFSPDRSSRGMRATISGDVLFDSGQVTVKPSARKQLDRLASDIKSRYSGADVRVEGYTDTDPIRKSKWGSNEALSQARAEAVRDYLGSKGISASAIGMGSANPKATKAASRRVEIVVMR